MTCPNYFSVVCIRIAFVVGIAICPAAWAVIVTVGQ